MSKERYFFESIDSETCYLLEHHLEIAKSDGLKEITLVEAIKDTDKTYTWCTLYGVLERSECVKSECKKYTSKSGRGVCSHRGGLYHHGEEIIFKV